MANDIQQRALGDCYFMSSMAALCEFPERVRKLFPIDKVNPQGKYGMTLTKNGVRQVVYVDDYIPCVNGQPHFTSNNGPELWMLIAEKCWAKIHGSYEVIIGGMMHDTLRDITGAPGVFIAHQ